MSETTKHTAPRSGPLARRAERSWLTFTTGVTAVCAAAGAIGLVTGTVDLGSTLTGRLPWHSGVVAGLCLLAVVALPMTVCAVLAARNSPRYAWSALIAGALLVGWIAVELVVIRQFSWLQVVFVAVGLAVCALGRRRT